MPTTSKRGDFYSGLPWVHITPEQARGHPQGKLGVVLWLIAAYFIGISLLKFYLSLSYGAGFGSAVLNSIWPFLSGLGLAFRVPWAVVMATISAVLTAYALVRGIGGADTLFNLFQLIASVGIVFYLVDGDRPNLIYKHRYRKYSVDRDQNESTGNG